MAVNKRKRRPPVGASPGTLVLPRDGGTSKLTVIQYGIDHIQEQDLSDPSALREMKVADYTLWVHVQGVGDENLLRQIGEIFDIHPLAMEDIVHSPQRPKVEAYDHHIVYISRGVVTRSAGDCEDTQVNIFLGENYVLTFQHEYHQLLDPVRARLRQGVGKIRKSGADYLAYSVIDTLIDGFFPVLEDMGEYFQEVEERIIDEPDDALFKDVHRLRREMLHLRRAVWPQREALSALLRDDNRLIGESVRLFLRDCYDHCVQVIDVTETYRELAAGLVEVYLSSQNTRMNEVMKVLTMIATVFMPLSFVTGIYGMNFENMPELKTQYGYFIVLGIMAVMFSGMLLFFYKQGWFALKPRKRRKQSTKKC